MVKHLINENQWVWFVILILNIYGNVGRAYIFDFIAPLFLLFILSTHSNVFKYFSPGPFFFKCPVCRVRFGEDGRLVINFHCIQFSHIGYELTYVIISLSKHSSRCSVYLGWLKVL